VGLAPALFFLTLFCNLVLACSCYARKATARLSSSSIYLPTSVFPANDDVVSLQSLMPLALAAMQYQAVLPLHAHARDHIACLQSNLADRFHALVISLSQTTREPLTN